MVSDADLLSEGIPTVWRPGVYGNVAECVNYGEFSQAILMAVYIPPFANADAAFDIVHSVTCRL